MIICFLLSPCSGLIRLRTPCAPSPWRLSPFTLSKHRLIASRHLAPLAVATGGSAAHSTLSKPAEETSTQSQSTVSASPRYACPTCRSPVEPLKDASCPTCNNQFSVSDGYIEMMPKQSNAQQQLPVPEQLSKLLPVGLVRRTLFESPIISYVYERGWRQNFATMGFPGPDAEYRMLESFFLQPGDYPPSSRLESSVTDARPVITLDLSCGSGLIARRMVSSGKLGRVIALDYSAAMLREAIKRAEKANLTFDTVRADVARLPFEANSIDFVHAGAALHCWPKVLDGLAEVHRVLVPGGRFFASTILKSALRPVGRLRSLTQNTRTSLPSAFRFFDESELRRLVQASGFPKESITLEILNNCVIVRCEKKVS